jgi:hypothetical protein
MRLSVSWPGGASPSRSASATAASDSGPTRADARLADLEGEADAADLAGLGEQPLHGQLEVVDLLEREVDALGDAADDEAHHGLEIAGQRRLEVDAFRLDGQRGSPMVPSPRTRS